MVIWYYSAMMLKSEREKFIDSHRAMLWYTPEASKRDISDELLVETTLNYGTLADYRALRDILTPQRLSHVFCLAHWPSTFD